MTKYVIYVEHLVTFKCRMNTYFVSIWLSSANKELKNETTNKNSTATEFIIVWILLDIGEKSLSRGSYFFGYDYFMIGTR